MKWPLVAGLAATLGVAPVARAQCTYTPLAEGVPTSAPEATASVTFSPAAGTFVALGLRSDASGQHQLTGYQSPGPPLACGSGLLASSITPSGVEVLVGDYRPGHNVAGPRYATGSRTSGGGGMTFEHESAARVLVVGEPPETTFAAPAVLDVYQTFLEGGSVYTLNLASAGADLKVLVFRNPGVGAFWAGRSGSQMLAVASAPTLFTAPASDDYALVVVNEDGAPGTYSFWVEQCQEPDTLYSTVARPTEHPYRDHIGVEDPYWQGVGIRSDPGSNWNTALYDTARGGPEPVCFEGLLGASTRPSGVDFVVGDLSNGPVRPFYARHSRAGGAGGAMVEWDAGPDEIAVGDTASAVHATTGPEDVLTVWDAYLAPGTTYTVLFSPSGAALRWFLFANPAQGPGGGHWFARDDAVLNATGNALFTPTTAGWHGLVVVNEDGAAGSYSLAIAGLPYVGVPDPGAAAKTALGAILPNPVRHRATIGFTLARASHVAVDVVDVAGRSIARLDGGTQAAGPGTLAWDGRDAQGRRPGAGVYFARLVVDGASIGAARLVLVR